MFQRGQDPEQKKDALLRRERQRAKKMEVCFWDLFVNPLTISPFETRIAQATALRHVPSRINDAPKHLSFTVHLNSRRETSNQSELFSLPPDFSVQ
jgi:hypothetical protein